MIKHQTHSLFPAARTLCLALAVLMLGSIGVAQGGEPVEWLIGFDRDWSSAVGAIKPSDEIMKIIDAAKSGAFVEPEEATAWQERVLDFMGGGLMAGRATILLAPGIGLPAQQMKAEQFTDASKMLDSFKTVPDEKLFAVVNVDDENVWEMWTSDAIYLHGYGGGLSRVQKTNYGWNYPSMMFDGEKEGLEVLRYWDLALSNDKMEDVERPKGLPPYFNIVKLVLDRSIEPKAITTIFATNHKHTDKMLLIQNQCRRMLTARISRALQKGKTMLADHSGFRCAKWGENYDETCRLLTPFLLHDSRENFTCSRLTPDIATFYSNHLASTKTVAKTIDAALWPSVLTLQSQQIAEDNAGRIGVSIGTHSFGGGARQLPEFMAITGIPVAPDFDFWSYANAAGRYTAWFIDGKFYAMEIEPSNDAAKHCDEVMADLTRRYGEFVDQPGKWGKSLYRHEDAEGGTIVRYEPSGGKREVKMIYHYSLKMRPMVIAKLAALADAADKKADEAKAATAKKASQF